MLKNNFVCVFVVSVFFNVVLTAEDKADNRAGDNNINIERMVGRAYSIATCDYKTQIGYTCLSCHRALHCYPGNAAILVDCYGIFRFCRDGRCSRFQSEKCLAETKLSTAGPSIINATLSDITTLEATTKIISEISTETASALVDSKLSDDVDVTESDALSQSDLNTVV